MAFGFTVVSCEDQVLTDGPLTSVEFEPVAAVDVEETGVAPRGTSCVAAAATPCGRRPVATPVEVIPASAIAALETFFHLGSV